MTPENLCLIPAAGRAKGRHFVFGDDAAMCEWAAARIEGVNKFAAGAVAIGLVQGLDPLVSVVYDRFSGNDICMHVAAVPGRLWASPEVLRVFFAYPFLQLGTARVTALVAASNAACRSFTEGLGWKQEGVLREGMAADDIVVYGMLKRECRWIGSAQ